MSASSHFSLYQIISRNLFLLSLLTISMQASFIWERAKSLVWPSELVARGYVVIAPDALAFEDRNWSNPSGEAESFELATRLIQGKTLLAKCLHDVGVALDYLMTRQEVDPLRIGFIGHSYGGKMAIWAAALDERIGASVSNCGCVSFKQSLLRDTRRANGILSAWHTAIGAMWEMSSRLLRLELCFFKQRQTMFGLGGRRRYLKTPN
jgi:hypothetical protein